DDMLARSDEFFSDEANVKGSIEVCEKAFEHIREDGRVAPSDGHPFWQIVDNLWRLETSQCLAMSWNSSVVECADAMFVLFFMDHFLLLLRVTPRPIRSIVASCGVSRMKSVTE